ncbi:hypothetical protein XA68_16203 [Ophiocordyceps unilateralis]|uniref:Uncharacterized protein n=1 Tax=Ophiocordyceps unilateralis TaxID=268505 RepID=A0A2A9P720_OPHUN|nr:hypothetical protein XA68_16203 [Ophiocordyceps unilateralis]
MALERYDIPGVDIGGFLSCERIYDVLECDLLNRESNTQKREVIIISSEVRNVIYHSFLGLDSGNSKEVVQGASSRRELQRQWDMGNVNIKKRGTIKEKSIDWFFQICKQVGAKAEMGKADELMVELWAKVEEEGLLQTSC